MLNFLKKGTHTGERASEAKSHYAFEIPFDELKDDSVVCNCAKITYADVKRELGYGIESADELLAELDAGTSCRKCVSYLERLIEHAKSELSLDF